jgi:hypothetical protein
MELRNGQLLPVSQYDAERMDDFADGTLFNVKSTKQRSNPHHNLYWGALRKVCKATGKWPTEQHLHDELKFACGYYRMRYSEITGMFMRYPDSIGFDDMNQEEFNTYFEMAMEKLGEAIGYDPITENPKGP